MSETTPPDKSQRFPRLALITVAVGLLVSAMVLALAHLPGGTSKEPDWDTVEKIEVPAPAKLGKNGSLSLARTSLSALAPNISNELIFMVAGLVNVDPGAAGATTVKCDVFGKGKLVLDDNGDPMEETIIARTPNLRAAWPRPSDDLQAQEVPDLAVTKFHALGADVLGMPIRDYFRRYTDSASPTTVEWDTDDNATRQTWIWDMPEGPGTGPASLGYAVIFKTIVRPAGRVRCEATSGKSKATVNVPFRQKEWPIVVPEEDAAA